MQMHHRAITILIAASVLGCSSQTPTPLPKPSPSAPPTPLPTSTRPAPVAPQPRPTLVATATLHDLAGARVGLVTFTDSYAGVIIAGTITGLGLGAHAVHIHEIGKCQAPFTSAGAHLNPHGKHHGFLNADGPHLGDLPNIDTPAAGKLKFDFLLAGASLKGSDALLDADGASIVIHGSRDNYYSDPTGDSGSRIACGVIALK
jgi:Cu-Zn family superoxide dismutase